jgi:parallel beta-helix repeat protein
MTTREEPMRITIFEVVILMLVAGIGLVGSGTLSIRAESWTIVVPEDFPTINEAVRNAMHGDTIYVKAGTYSESSICVDKSLLIIGEDRNVTIVSGEFRVQADDVTISGFTIMNSVWGVIVERKARVAISGNLFVNNVDNIDLLGTSDSLIINNIISCSNPDQGGIILIFGSCNNTIQGNEVIGGWYGLCVAESSQQNIIRDNIIRQASRNPDLDVGAGIIVSSMSEPACNENVFFNNSLINNKPQVYNFVWDNSNLQTCFNKWDRDYPTGGNYWTDYSGTDYFCGPYQNQTGRDGIGDSPYVIDEHNADRYPLMSRSMTPFDIDVISPQNTTYTANTLSLEFTSSEMTSWMGYSLDGQALTTVDGNTTLQDLAEGNHTLVVYARDDSGNLGSSEPVQFGILPRSLPTKCFLTVTGSPVEINFAINGTQQLTPYISGFDEGSILNVTMPDAFVVNEGKYQWARWADGDQNLTKSIILTANTTLTGCYTGPYYEIKTTSATTPEMQTIEMAGSNASSPQATAIESLPSSVIENTQEQPWEKTNVADRSPMLAPSGCEGARESEYAPVIPASPLTLPAIIAAIFVTAVLRKSRRPSFLVRS